MDVKAVAMAFAVVAMGTLSVACGTSYPKATVQHDKTLALAVFTNLAAGDDTQAEGQFDAQMTAALGATKLGQTWSALTAAAGAFQKEGAPTAFASGGDLVVDIPLSFSHGSRVGRVSFNSQGQVAGLFFLN